MSFHCRSCQSARIKRVIDLGQTPLANALRAKDDLAVPDQLYPLDVIYCTDCTLVQITETVPPETLFSNYVYFSSFSDTAVASAKDLANRLIDEKALGPSSLVIEVASNDGYLLRNYVEKGIPVLGVEPAANIAEAAMNSGVETRCAFFGAEEAECMAQEGLFADVIHANNVLAHVADLNGFVAGIAWLLKEDGVASIEVPYLRDLIEKIEFDTIYHEHLCYFSATALDHLFARHGLLLADVERIPIHGGSLRLFVMRESAQRSQRACSMLEEERAAGMTDYAYYSDFAAKVGALKSNLQKMLKELKDEGATLAAYGASAKGTTLLSTIEVGADLLDFVVDRSTVKQGYFTPGTHLPILPPSALTERMPDYVLLLTWNFADEILAQQSEYRARGGRFIVPVPDVRII